MSAGSADSLLWTLQRLCKKKNLWRFSVHIISYGDVYTTALHCKLKVPCCFDRYKITQLRHSLRLPRAAFSRTEASKSTYGLFGCYVLVQSITHWSNDVTSIGRKALHHQPLRIIPLSSREGTADCVWTLLCFLNTDLIETTRSNFLNVYSESAPK